MSENVRAAAGPGYSRPLSNAQKRALHVIGLMGDIRYPSSAVVRANTVKALLEFGLVEHCEMSIGNGEKTRSAIRLTMLGEIMRRQIE